MKLMCAIGLHDRSTSQMWVDGSYCRSYCRQCSVPLVRLAPRKWQAVTGRRAQLFNN